jgi:hypothetical protein
VHTKHVNVITGQIQQSVHFHCTILYKVYDTLQIQFSYAVVHLRPVTISVIHLVGVGCAVATDADAVAVPYSCSQSAVGSLTGRPAAVYTSSMTTWLAMQSC